jgi:hypothetical protein
MFGHNEDQSLPQPDNSDNSTTDADQVASPAPDSPAPSAPPVPDPAWQHPGTPLNNDNPAAPADSGTPPTSSLINPPATPAENIVHPSASHLSPAAVGTAGDLADLRQKALGQLTPLVSHLDQSPEDKFRVLMMMIQARDDQSMLQEAYDTAQKITDEKTKAQALLDVINEINYFTQHKD